MRLKRVIIKLGICALSGVFSIMKLFPMKNRVVMMSRQSNTPSQDFEMLQDELTVRNIDTVVMCKKMNDGISGAVNYLGELFRQMNYLATSKVIILDSYNIPVSLFKHREDTTVIQMWHALGSMKKFSRSILDQPEGKSSEIAELMKMHEGYDVIFTSSEASRPAFAEAFGYPQEALTIMSLPRVDALLDKEQDEFMREAVRAFYPGLTDRKMIVYVPTLRVGKDMTEIVENLIDAVDDRKYNLIIKMHPLTVINIKRELPDNVIIDNMFKSAEMLSMADYVITDYSAMTYEIALKGLPMFFYVPDKEEYMKDRAFYLDYETDMPGPICTTAEEVMSEISSKKNSDKYRKKAKAFADKYIEKKENCTKEIADMIEVLL